VSSVSFKGNTGLFLIFIFVLFTKHILQNRNDKVIAKTVRLLPTNYIIILFRELSKRIQGHAQAGLGIIKWLKALLTTHTSFLMSVS
jgi:hypothetical protein